MEIALSNSLLNTGWSSNITVSLLFYRPTLNEIKDDVLSRRGGLCYTLNAFMKYLLEALKYDVHLLMSSMCSNGYDSHVLIIVNNATKKQGERHLVDVGSGYPILMPVPLNFEQESQVFSSSYIQWKYKYAEGKLIQYINKDVKYLQPSKTESESNVWRPFCMIDFATSEEHSFVSEVMDKVYTDIESNITHFHESLQIAASIGEGKRTIALKDSSFFVEDESHCLIEMKIRSPEEFLQNMEQFFPQLRGQAELALKNVKCK